MHVLVYYYKQAVTYIVGLRYKLGAYRKGPVTRATDSYKSLLSIYSHYKGAIALFRRRL